LAAPAVHTYVEHSPDGQFRVQALSPQHPQAPVAPLLSSVVAFGIGGHRVVGELCVGECRDIDAITEEGFCLQSLAKWFFAKVSISVWLYMPLCVCLSLCLFCYPSTALVWFWISPSAACREMRKDALGFWISLADAFYRVLDISLSCIWQQKEILVWEMCACAHSLYMYALCVVLGVESLCALVFWIKKMQSLEMKAAFLENECSL
jgi:hypothetical protein